DFPRREKEARIAKNATKQRPVGRSVQHKTRDEFVKKDAAILLNPSSDSGIRGQGSGVPRKNHQDRTRLEPNSRSRQVSVANLSGTLFDMTMRPLRNAVRVLVKIGTKEV